MRPDRGKNKFLSAIRLLLSLQLVVLSGCPARQGVPPPSIPPAELTLPDKAEFLAGLAAAGRQIDSLKALSRTSIEENSEKSRVRHVVLLIKPDHLRIDTLAQNSAYPLNLLIAKQGEAVFVDPIGKMALISKDGDKAIKRVLGMPVEVSELMAYLTGRMPVELLAELKHSENAGFFGELSGEVVLVDRARRRFWIFDGASRLLKKVHFRNASDQAVLLDMEFKSYTESAGTLLPQRIRVQIPKEKLIIAMNFSAFSLNQDRIDQRFDFKIPADYRIRFG